MLLLKQFKMDCLHTILVLNVFTIFTGISSHDQLKYIPKNLCVRLITNTSAVVQWFEPAVAHEDMGYTIFHTRYPELPLKDWNFTVIGGYPLATVGNITLGEVYTFRIRLDTLGLEGPGLISDNYSVRLFNRTKSCYGPSKTSTIRSLNILRAAATSYTSVEVWWNVPHDPHRNTGYCIFYGINKSLHWDWKNVTVGLVQNVELTNLEQSAIYKISLALLSNSGLEHFVQDVTVKVQPEEVPFNVMVYDITPTSMAIHWSPPTRFNPCKYKIVYDAYKEYISATGIKQHIRLPKFEQIVDGDIRDRYFNNTLSPNTLYNINISAIPIDNSYRPAAKITAKTQMSAPPPLTKPDIYEPVQGGNIQVLLPRASEEFGPVGHYYIVVISQNGTHLDPPSNTYSIEDMLESDFNEKEVPAYIAAKFAQSIPYAFMFGDGEQYSGYTNRKLKSGMKYKMFVRAVVDSPLEDLFTDSPYSDVFS